MIGVTQVLVFLKWCFNLEKLLPMALPFSLSVNLDFILASGTLFYMLFAVGALKPFDSTALDFEILKVLALTEFAYEE